MHFCIKLNTKSYLSIEDLFKKPRMININNLTVKNYKNIRKMHLNNLSRINYLIGRNGSGKSAFMEALSLALNSDLAKIEYDGSSISGYLGQPERIFIDNQMAIKIEADDGEYEI